ncbi:hypothetical protein EDI_150270 [Entamoeba dispar SAW760]|uniref:Uncharacterized protein n=2 Tax=Entamoeba dispar (strain ATCC PRA-260 / SAW760) TaxID=370354 RepID=B0E5Z1_ENTDS|nr:uncharacterized protein EDI_150270 [Entamoeba dispar SAW760]EDR30055.1 hypothetical protein EDI_150270 [Entamoeba dispar SAW760]|eukprot:EDR30055.1 hypothetical protein EDI_150270 [Entamoeba dispar SAW760]
MSRNQGTRTPIQPLSYLPQLPVLVKISCSTLCHLNKWGEEDIERLKKELSAMLDSVISMKENLRIQYDSCLKDYKPHHHENHTRQRPPVQQQNIVSAPEPILCISNEPAREYWENIVYPYIKYPSKEDVVLLEPMEEEGEDINNCPLGRRDQVIEYSAREKLIDGLVETDTERFRKDMEEESVVRGRLESCGIILQKEMNGINIHTRRDDEISCELRRLNAQLIEKRRFINECRKKMREYYKRVEGKQAEFDKLQKEEKSYKCH